MKKRNNKITYMTALLSAVMVACHLFAVGVCAAEESDDSAAVDEYKDFGGGYAVTGQKSEVGYTYEIYDATNGLPTSDAMWVLGASDGHIWIGGYSGVIKYDGTNFDRLSTDEGLTSARAIYEDKRGRIWVGTNDNGVVVIDGEDRTHITYKDGLPSSSIRCFAEDKNGDVFVATTSGICYVDTIMKVHEVSHELVDGARVLKLDADSTGRIYGQASDGIVFLINNCKITRAFKSSELGMGNITTILADPRRVGKVYFGTDRSDIYYGDFGEDVENMRRISVRPLEGIHWLSYDCGRIWVSSTESMGWLDEKLRFRSIDKIGLDSGIEMTTSDYQGNIWVASSTQGVMKIVANNFVDLTSKAGLEAEVTNTTCLYRDRLYIGTDNGLRILNKQNVPEENELTEYLDGTRIRCIREDDAGNLWIATYTNNKGLICYGKDDSITPYTTDNGMPSNQIRCISMSESGNIIVGTNGGLAIINGLNRTIKTYGSEAGVKNTVILTAQELKEGYVMMGSDGDGIYMLEENTITSISRDDGLTSDVVMRMIRDERREVIWVVTSNSIQFFKNGTARTVTTFPYNNNYDIYFDDKDGAWILSSYGIFNVSVTDMLNDEVTSYKLYSVENGLPYAATSNSYGCIDDKGNLFIPGRYGVIKVNIDNYYEEHTKIKIDVGAVYCDDEKIIPDENGAYKIPALVDRIQVVPAVMDYTIINPLIRIYLEGGPDEGVTAQKNKISSLEYTNLPYGRYILHLQVLEDENGKVLQDNVCQIIKNPRFTELFLVRVAIFALVAAAAGFIVWRVMRSTVISRQYDEIRKARDEAERANSSKSRFLANMSHEIRTPINTIMGMNEMVLREDATGVPKGYFMSMINYSLDIRNASESLLGLINDLLDISKIESGKMHLVEQEYDLQDMLRSIVSMIRVRSIEKELTFDVVVDEILPKRLYGDMGKIKQIVLNLLTNAVKYTEKGGFILNVSMDERENDVCFMRFSVKDTGIGVKEEDMEKLFTAYERLDEERNSGIQGTGLGLDISRRFAELMGGRLWCESVYGQGSEFILTVHQGIVDETPVGMFAEHDDQTAKGPYIPKFIAPDADILVVDDNPMNLSVIKGLLKATKVFVTTSASGEDALEKIRDNHFDVVLLDHMMPGMDGIETVGHIREMYPDLPVYALTANSTAGEDFYKSKGFNGYLSKPVESEVLEKTIMKHLPESMMEKPTEADAVAELTELPEDMTWVNDVEGINVDEGIKNSGGISSYIFSLDLFYDTIDGNVKAIREAYESDNIRLYTIKVHALKSSARIIGAKALSELAEQLENAGNHMDKDFIDENNAIFIEDYIAYKEKLEPIKHRGSSDADKDPIPEEELKDAYDALGDLIPMMDYDSVEMVLNQLSEYKLPEKDEKLMSELTRLMKSFDWEAMEELFNNR